MTAFEAAATWHRDHMKPDSYTLAEIMELHLLGSGCLIATPTVFCLFRPVMSEWSFDKMENPNISGSKAEADCWFVWLAAGNVREALALAKPREWVAYRHRGKRIKIRYDRLIKGLA